MKRIEKMVTISAKEAERLLKFNNFVGQRNIREHHVVTLAEKMENGLFHVGSVALVHKDDTTLLADGQHQLTASSLSGRPFKAVVTEWHLNGDGDADAMAKIFSQYNIEVPRTRGDIAWIWACQLGWSEWPRKLVTNASSALTMLDKGDFLCTTKLPKDSAAALLSVNRNVCEWLHGMEVSAHRHMLRAPVLASMIATWRKAQKASSEFWLSVRDGEGLAKKDPRLQLRDFLKDVNLQSGEKNPSGRATTDRRAMYAKCIHAWNAWREDRPTSLKYHATAALPRPL